MTQSPRNRMIQMNHEKDYMDLIPLWCKDLPVKREYKLKTLKKKLGGKKQYVIQ